MRQRAARRRDIHSSATDRQRRPLKVELAEEEADQLNS